MSGNTASRESLPTLNALRGIAALMVCMMHFGDVWQPGVGEWLLASTFLLDNAYLWVDFFFLLSGFVLTHVYHVSFSRGVGKNQLTTFMWARFARIYPLHAAMLLLLVGREAFFMLVYVVKNGADQWLALWPADNMPFTGSFSLVELAKQILLLQSLTVDTQHVSWNFPAWSIATEWYAYWLLPFWIALFYRPLQQSHLCISKWLTLLAVATLALWNIGARSEFDLDIAGLWGLGRCIIESMLGMASYKLYRHARLHPALHQSWFLLLVCGGLVAVMHWNLPDALAIPLFVLLILGCTQNRRGFHSVLESSVGRRLGDLSYSIYLIHTPVRILVADAWLILTGTALQESFNLPQAFLVWLGGIALVVALSTLTFRFIEVPAQHWLRQHSPFKRIPSS